MKQNRNKRALVTGGAGFVGPHLIGHLLDQGWEVMAVDNFSTGMRHHVTPFLSQAGFQLAEGDITDPTFVEEAVSLFRPVVIYHLAAIHFIPYCVAHPAETLSVNVVGTQRLLDTMERSGPSRFIFASTGDVYVSSDAPHTESSPVGSFNVYGLSKLFSEQLLSSSQQKYPETRFIRARLFNIFGPGETNPHVLPDMLKGLKSSNTLRLGNMEARRDYVYVGDVAEALLRLGMYEGNESVFNVGTGIGRSVWDLVKTLEAITGRNILVETDPAKVRAVERQRLVADIARIRAELGWAPSVSLENGLRATLEESGLASG